MTIQTPFTDEGGCIVTETSELLWKLWASAYQRITKEPCPLTSTQQGPDAHRLEDIEWRAVNGSWALSLAYGHSLLHATHLPRRKVSTFWKEMLCWTRTICCGVHANLVWVNNSWIWQHTPHLVRVDLTEGQLPVTKLTRNETNAVICEIGEQSCYGRWQRCRNGIKYRNKSHLWVTPPRVLHCSHSVYSGNYVCTYLSMCRNGATR